MSILTATLLSLLYFWGNSAFVLGVNWWTVMRPLVSGFLAGVILGDPVKGAMVGAQINILYLGFIGAGGALPGDICLAELRVTMTPPAIITKTLMNRTRNSIHIFVLVRFYGLNVLVIRLLDRWLSLP